MVRVHVSGDLRAAFVGALVASLLVTTGAAWFSFGAGLIVAGVCAAVVTVLFLVDVGGDE